MKIKWLDRTVLRGVRLALCTTEKQYLKAAKRVGVVDPLPWIAHSLAASNHTFTRPESVVCVVCIKILKRPIAETFSMLVHEATHVKQELLESINEKHPGNEIEAYIMENITRELFVEYQRHAKK